MGVHVAARLLYRLGLRNLVCLHLVYLGVGGGVPGWHLRGYDLITSIPGCRCSGSDRCNRGRGRIMASKLRCGRCREYFPKDEMYRTGTSSVCSPECMLNPVPRRRRSASSSRSRPSAPPEIRMEIRRRDGQRCRWCGATRTLQVHHINYRSEGLDDSPINLVTLCAKHHAKVHENKRKYQPILRGIIWKTYVDGMMMTVPEFERRYWPSYEAAYPPISFL